MEELSRGHRFFETGQMLRQFNFSAALGILPHSEMHVLGKIGEWIKEHGTGDVSLTDLTRKLEVSKPAVSRTLRNLENKGYIYRRVDEHDRRNTFVTLTEEGIKEMEHSMREICLYMDRALSHLTQEEIETFFYLSHKVHEGMQEELQRRQHKQ